MSTKKEKYMCNQCSRCAVENTAVLGCADDDCHCHQTESIDLDEIDNKITDLIQRLPFEKRGEIWTLIYESRKQAITTAVEERERVDENTSDGYHTFKELYEFRKVYNAVLFNEWAKQGKYNVHKSLKHSDGEDCFGGGWFIVTATLPSGQISNHYELKDWKLFRVDEHVKADEWDGHTAQDVVNRLLSNINPSKE